LLLNDAVVAHLVNALRHPVGFDVFTRCEWIDVHAPEAHTLRVGPAGFFELDRDIGLHAHDIRDFHRAAKMHDGCRMSAAELRELRQYPTGAQTFGHRTTDDAPEIEILIEMGAQRQQIANLLNVSVTFFFSGMGARTKKDATPSGLAFLQTKGALRLIRAYTEITSRTTKYALVVLAEGLRNREKG
jgi:hypothetical protein